MTYRERSDGSGGELGEVEMLGLNFLANSKGAFALQLVRGDGSDTLADGVVRGAFKVATLGNGDLVRLESGGHSGILGTGENSSNGCNLSGLLQSKGEPILLLSSQLVFGG